MTYEDEAIKNIKKEIGKKDKSKVMDHIDIVAEIAFLRDCNHILVNIFNFLRPESVTARQVATVYSMIKKRLKFFEVR